MSRRRSTAHWQRLESTFRATYGWRWRAIAAGALGIERSQLRAAVDREMTHDDLCALEDTMMAEMSAYVSQLIAHIDRVREMHSDVEAQRYRRIKAKAVTAAEMTMDEFFTGWAAEADIRAQFGKRIEEEDARERQLA
ncbi:MAG TPA: hypothetical protein VK512_01035 [Xanthobacteraceae bacterium]|nr:hypothetical protein [Xanthobacteraceae bacterium]